MITIFVGLFFVLAQIIEPGALFGRAYFFTGDLFEQEESVAKLTEIFILFPHGITALAMVTAEICARIMRPVSTIVHPVCSAGFIVNNIPFVSLNFSIVLVIVLQIVTGVFFEFVLPFWLLVSALITTILVTNKGAKKHVASRLRQQIDTLTIGGNNMVAQNEPVHPVVDQDEPVHPIVPVALVPVGGTPTRAAVVSIELQPLRVGVLIGDASKLPPPPRATLCPVGE